MSTLKQRHYKRQITAVYVFVNDTVAVLDQDGTQMIKFEGAQTLKLMKKIKDRMNRQKTPVAWHDKIKMQETQIMWTGAQ